MEERTVRAIDLVLKAPMPASRTSCVKAMVSAKSSLRRHAENSPMFEEKEQDAELREQLASALTIEDDDVDCETDEDDIEKEEDDIVEIENDTDEVSESRPLSLQRQTSMIVEQQVGLGERKPTLFLSRANTRVNLKANDVKEKDAQRHGILKNVKTGNSTTPGLIREPTKIEKDAVAIDPEIAKTFKPKKKFEKKWGKIDRDEVEKNERINLYTNMCKKMGIVPARFISASINSSQMKIVGHKIGPDGMRALAVGLVNNPCVELIDLEENYLGPEGILHVSELILCNSYLKEIHIANNNIGGEGVRAICDAMRENENIRVLNISSNHIQDAHAIFIARMIEDNIHLRKLDLSHNELRGEGAVAIGLSLRNNDTLEILDLGWNQLRGRGAMSVAVGLKDNTGLKMVNLAYNGFSNDGCHRLGITMRRNNTLVELDLSNNRIGAEGLIKITKGLQRNSTLEILRLGRNPFNLKATQALLETIRQKKTIAIKLLDLSHIPVNQDFAHFSEVLKLQRQGFATITGPVVKGDVRERKKDEIDYTKDPLTILFDFMKQEGYRVIDLFKVLGAENIITTKEFKKGMIEMQVPITESQLIELIKKADSNHDGKIELGEMINVERQYKREQIAKVQAKEAKERQKQVEKKIKKIKGQKEKDNFDYLPPIKKKTKKESNVNAPLTI
ncbi:unnamed protein product [Owenia fusiformis]|uniref:Uncharacterized protein n=1 Tax=Owenia fusiformis TaxID=6347 RepID=A0A8J1THY0_OWEFU|nr:unnamed protein product [Owenia fusiformis]